MEGKKYDMVIVGAGPAGLTSAIYAGRYLLNTLVIGEVEGGTISEAHKVCNFPSYETISGMELTKRMVEQIKRLDVKIEQEDVEKIEKGKGDSDGFEIKTSSSMYSAKKIILATGGKKRTLNVKGEKEFSGKGVSYCATCDAAFFGDKAVAVVGGSNAALTAALLLSEYANKIYIIYRKEKFFRASPAWVREAKENKKIEMVFNSTIKEIKGSNTVEKIVLDSGKELSVDGVFVEIGSIPNAELARKLNLELDEGYISVDKFQRTSLPGIFAAGDVTNNPLKQAVTAAAEGAIASASAYREIRGGN